MRDDLLEVQRSLGETAPPPWSASKSACGSEPQSAGVPIGGCFMCFGRGGTGPGHPGDPAWAAAAIVSEGRLVAGAVVQGEADAAYEAGLLALREGALLEAAVRALPELPAVLLVNATGRDHPRRAELAVHLGAVLDVPTVGVTHRPLLAVGPWPKNEPGAAAPLRIGDDLVGYWLRTRAGTRPLAVQAGWRTDAETALEVARAAVVSTRTPAALREARRLARTARAAKVSVRGGAGRDPA